LPASRASQMVGFMGANHHHIRLNLKLRCLSYGRILDFDLLGIELPISTARCCMHRRGRLKSLFSPPSHPPLSVDVSVMDFKNLSANLTNITNTLAEKPSITTLATILLSFTGLQDWLKLFLIGGVFETCRRVIFQAWHNTVDSLWITVDFEEGDESYGENLAPPVGRSIITVMPARIRY
jgi:hypothetical protein